MPQVTIDNHIISVSAGTGLSALLPGASHPCGGKGACGKCKVRVQGSVSPLTAVERRHLTPPEIADGIRLSCQTTVQGDCRVATLTTHPVTILAAETTTPKPLCPGFSRYGVAVDIGTTTLAARLYAPDGTLLAQTGASNPQTAYGADVLTRAETALGGQAEALTAAVRDGVAGLVARLTADAGITPMDLDGMVVTGNTVMLTLLTGGDVTPFATAPFIGHHRFGCTAVGAVIGLTPCPDVPVYFPPCVSAFIGGDTATALVAADLPENALLLDIGTNGEMVLYTGGRLYACSTSAGPAFEGVGISCGMVASPGAVDRVELVNGTLHPHVMGGGTAMGVCGSGLIDTLACLTLLGDLTGPVALTPEVTLTSEDIQALLTSKSAIRSGIDTLLYTAGLTPDAVTEVVIAGGFGSYLNVSNAIRVGLLPPIPPERIRAVGNGALDGAAQVLLNTCLRDSLSRLTAAVQVVDLAQNDYFAKRFIQNMTPGV